MILIGHLDSPFVRRVAVTMNFYGLAFQRNPLSVFGNFEAMLALNPLGKVPALMLDDNEVLIDSRAIVDYLDGLVAPGKRLVPADEPNRHRVMRIEAVALGLAEKSVERSVELYRRAPDKRDPAWLERVERQIVSALDWLEVLAPSPWLHGAHITRADLTAAIAYTFLAENHGSFLDARPHPELAAHCRRCEALDEMKASPYQVG
jgi:glutathione S-transferase